MGGSGTSKNKVLAEQQREKEAYPEHFCTYPNQPNRKFVPIPELMHQLIFRALEQHIGTQRLKEIFGAKANESPVNWNTGNLREPISEKREE